jgi:Zn-dependent peptidase ImmA (M78 family)
MKQDFELCQAVDNNSITALVMTLLEEFDTPKVFVRDPSVDIRGIAKSLSIEIIDTADLGDHAVFQNNVLELNAADSPEKKAFSIAHEIGHLAFGHIDVKTGFQIARLGIRKTADLIKDNPIKSEKIEQYLSEKIADYFAANLLVPVNRFLLWDDQPDDIIARAFKVEEPCIRKRRKEIAETVPEMLKNTKPLQDACFAETRN